MAKGRMKRIGIQGAAVTIALTLFAHAVPALAQSQTFAVDIRAQDLGSALQALARATRQQVVFARRDVRGKRSPALKGSYTAREALQTLLAGSDLTVATGQSGVLIVRPQQEAQLPAGTDEAADDELAAVPDILVTGKRNWSLNTGIERTRDDSQPFVVFKQEDIRRSGATNLERFLSDFLTSNASAGSSEQRKASEPQGRSNINLRGLGARETLILVDGRRQPGINVGSGSIEQAAITNIPLAAIERIEVLSSSAAGLYGTGATGGVVNIILRRDYRGAEITLNYADTTDFRAPDGRIDLVGGLTLEGGRTNVSFTGTYRRSDPLTRNERRDLIVGARRRGFSNNPNFFSQPPLGATPNIRSSFGDPLQLDPAYGGATLPSNFTFVPVGFRGIALDGVAPLIANAGNYNLELADFAGLGGTGEGGRVPVIYGNDQLSGTMSVRREMTSWLKLYGEVAASRFKSRSVGSAVNSVLTVRLGPDAPNNPFQDFIDVAVPQYGYDIESIATNNQFRVIGGAIVQLPYSWSAALDVSYNRSGYHVPVPPPGLDQTSRTGLTNGSLDVVRDLQLAPINLAFITSTFPDLDFSSTERDVQVKLAGPLPIKLPGGKPILSLSLERSRQVSGAVYGISATQTAASISYTAPRSERIESAYGEIRIPLISSANRVPLVREFEITAAVRHERYKGVGSNIGQPCFDSTTGFPAGVIDVSACDPSKLTFPEVSFTNSHTDPSVSMRWTVIPDIVVRASYATGYLTPRLGDLIRVPTTFLVVQATDPERGNEPVGRQLGGGIGLLPGFEGGNADLENETSTTYSAGVILTPRFASGLRFSADWTRIRKTGNIARPGSLLISSLNADGQRAFDTFLQLFPDRITRGTATGGFAVGPITAIDASFVNIAGTEVEVIDFAADYEHGLWGGRLNLSSNASYSIKSTAQAFPDSTAFDFSGVVPLVAGPAFGAGALKWKGNASAIWSGDRATIGVRGRYFDSYFLNQDRSISIDNASAKIDSQLYFDVFGSYRFGRSLTLRGGVNNVFDHKPPYVSGTYSQFGDPRLANFYLALNKAF